MHVTLCIYAGVPLYNLMGESASVPAAKQGQSHTAHFGGHLWRGRKRTSRGMSGVPVFTFYNSLLLHRLNAC